MAQTLVAHGELISDTYRIVVVQPTTLCNLDCRYCYLPDRKRQQLMGVDVAAAIAASIAEQGRAQAVEVVWHGGEPLATPIEHLRTLLAEFEALRRAGRLVHSVQTNATLINPAWCELLHEYEFRVGVSLDGPQTHNAERGDWAGRSSFARTMRGITRLGEAGIAFSAICVVTPQTIGYADKLVRFFERLGCASVGFNLEEVEGINTSRPQITMAQAEAFWRQLWQRRQDGSPLPIRDLDRLARYLRHARATGEFDAAYDPIPTVAHNGDTVILSPELAGITAPDYHDFILGNVIGESLPAMLARASQVRYVNEFTQALRSCAASCEFWDFCRGAQAGNRYFEHGTFTATETSYCRNTRQALVRAALTHLTEGN